MMEMVEETECTNSDWNTQFVGVGKKAERKSGPWSIVHGNRRSLLILTKIAMETCGKG